VPVCEGFRQNRQVQHVVSDEKLCTICCAFLLHFFNENGSIDTYEKTRRGFHVSSY